MAQNSKIHPALTGCLNSTAPVEKRINFSPGPTSLPKEVEKEIAESFHKLGFTSLAISHRSPQFEEILEDTITSIREVLNVPDTYEVLFTHGGGHAQFAAVPLNLCVNPSDIATYIVNGTWSQKGRDEAMKYCDVHTIEAKDENGKFTVFPKLKEEDIHPESKYVYLCSNETVNGIELHRLPKLPENRKHIPLIVDASSDACTKPIDWEGANIGVYFACASKNIGHPGVTMTIVRKDLFRGKEPSKLCPVVMSYKGDGRPEKPLNTPATFNIEVIGMTMKWLLRNGGIDACEKRSINKARAIYDVIEASNGFYATPIKDKNLRSRMNVPFNVMGGDEQMTNKFLIESWEKGFVGFATLTPFGTREYLRASLYNGVTEEEAQILANFMTNFIKQNSKK